MKKVYHLTAQGKVDLEAELKELVSSRGDIADEIAAARSNGDLSENAEYTSARERQSLVESRISELESILANAEIIQSDGDGIVSLGDTVVVSSGSKEHTFHIVGSIEADPSADRISHDSPLGKALIGAKQGDEVSVATPKGEKIYKVISVN